MSVDSENKEMLNMIHTMFSNLEEKLIKSQEKMGSNLEELKRARRWWVVI